MYVVSTTTTSTPAAVGAMQVLNSDDNGLGKPEGRYFKYYGPAGLMRTDLIKEGQVMEIKVTDADAMATPLHQVTVTLDSNVNGGAPIPGEDYELKIAISQFADLAEDSVYFKYGFVHATTAGTPDASSFYKRMALSLAKNFSREITKLFKFYVTIGTPVEVTPTTDIASLTGTATALVIEEIGEGHVGPYATASGANFTVTCDEIIFNGDRVRWATISAPAPYSYIANGSELAAMEYFFMGERGDQYRIFDQPVNRIPTTYLINPNIKYDVINIHYYFVDSLGGAQKSEKDITIVLEQSDTDDGVVVDGALNGDSDAAQLVSNIATALNVTTVKAIASDGTEYICTPIE